MIRFEHFRLAPPDRHWLAGCRALVVATTFARDRGGPSLAWRARPRGVPRFG
ncbi:MAG TPA: hypothetical protein VGI05_21185 [Streptosporangiaceae bacterium]